MSARSDAYERMVAKSINQIVGIRAIRPRADVRFADVRITADRVKTWLEVKMTHTANLSNPRMFYRGRRWHTTYKTPAAHHAVGLLNQSIETKTFVRNLASFSGIPESAIKIPTAKGGLSEHNAVPYETMVAFFEQIPAANKYIANVANRNLGQIVTEHYILGKQEPAHYMQAGDDFYMISERNPFKLSRNIPLLKGVGDFRVRISFIQAQRFYEVQGEIKIKNMPRSTFSVLPTSRKHNPFVHTE